MVSVSAVKCRLIYVIIKNTLSLKSQNMNSNVNTNNYLMILFTLRYNSQRRHKRDTSDDQEQSTIDYIFI